MSDKSFLRRQIHNVTLAGLSSGADSVSLSLLGGKHFCTKATILSSRFHTTMSESGIQITIPGAPVLVAYRLFCSAHFCTQILPMTI
jgi:hypothetical protein